MLRRFTEQHQQEKDEEEENGGSSNDEEDKHSTLDEDEEAENDERCRECNKRIYNYNLEWWCCCGYGLCAACRPFSALNHVCGCPKARKSAHSKRTQKNK